MNTQDANFYSQKKEFVDKLEHQYECILPEEYRCFLFREPTDIAKNNNKHFITKDHFFTVHHFLCDSTDYSLSFFSKNRVYKGRIPENMIAIASSPSGNLFILSVKGVDYGKIYYWNHEMETELADYSNVTCITNSFEDFLSMLKSEEEVDA